MDLPGKLTMRLVVISSLVAACLAGAALAQEAPPAEQAPIRLTWSEQPNAQDFARAYPRRALHQGAQGAAILCCQVRADGTLDCSIGFEWPRDYGFGEATLRIAREFRLSEESASIAAGGRIRRMIVWQTGDRTPQLDSVLTRIREGTANVCGPVVDWSERAPEDIIVTRGAEAP